NSAVNMRLEQRRFLISPGLQPGGPEQAPHIFFETASAVLEKISCVAGDAERLRRGMGRKINFAVQGILRYAAACQFIIA
ncbi:MAG: hypothetical protein D6814_11365, partial [Calditrichaeota bacterium]